MEKKWISIFVAHILIVLVIFSGQMIVFAQEEAGQESDVIDVEHAEITLTAGSEGREAKQQEEEVIEQIEEGAALLLMANSEDIVSKVMLSSASTKVTLVKGEAVYYGGWNTHYFYINGNLAYCLEPTASSPNSDDYAATVLANNELLSKALYYLVGGPGYTSALEEQFFPNTVGNTAINYCYSHVVLSYIYDNCSTSGDAFQGVSDAVIQQVINITNTIKEMDAAPDAELSISPSSQESVYVKSSNLQKTSDFKLTGDSKNYITVTLPDDVTIYNYTTEKSSKGNVTIYGGDKFYFTAPTSVTGTWETGKLYGSITDNYKALIINEDGSAQTVGSWSYAIAGDATPVSFSVKWLDMGQIKIKKVSSDTNATSDGVDDDYYSLKGATFEVRNSDGDVVDTLVTDENGGATSSLLPYAKYKLVETKNPTGYLFAADTSIEVEGSMTEVIIKEQPQYGKIELQKKSGDESATADGVDDSFYTLAGAIYEVFNSKGTTVASITTNAEGKASTGNLPLGKYTVMEKAGSSSVGYLVDKNIYEVEITSENRTSTVFVKSVISIETLQYGSIALKKLDSETNKSEPQGAASLEKATYEIFNSAGKRMETLITDAKGEAVTTGKYPLGNYMVKETISSEGYLVDQNIYNVKIESADRVTSLFVKGVTSKEDIIRGDVQIVKFRESKDEEEEIKNPLEGIQFTFTSKTTKKIVQTITTNVDGYATTATKEQPRGGLIYDTYIVEEVKETVPEGVKVIEPFEVTISEEGVIHYYIIEDKNIVSPITVVKKDSTTGNIIPVADTEFRLLDANKEPVTMTTYYPSKVVHEIFKTDKTGQFTFPEKVEYGTYYLEEVQAPVGYLKGELLEIKIEEGHKWDEPFVIEYQDEPAMGKIIVHKTDFDTEGNVEGAEFTVTAKEDIITADGTVRLKAGEVAGVITSNKNGIAMTDNLFLGLYVVEETKVPEGYVKPLVTKVVKLEYENQEVALVREVVEVVNHPTKIKLVKTKQGDSATTLAGVEFAFWKKTDVVLVNLEKEILTTDEDGQIILQYLHPGTYCFQEVSALPGYLLDDTIHEITIDENGFVDEKRVGILEIENDFTKVDISKQEVVGEQEIDGAEMELTDKDGKIIEKWISGEEPHRIEALTPGEYILKENLAPLGYLVSSEVAFIIEETGDVQTIVMHDEIPMGQVLIHKTDEETKKALAGVKYELLDPDGKVLETLVTDDSGKAISQLYQIGIYVDGKFVEYFKYTLIETEALEGYEIDKTSYEVVFEYVDGNTPVIKTSFSLTNRLIPEESETETETEEKKAEVPVTTGISTTPSAGKTAVSSYAPKTGDNTPIIALILMFAVSATGVGVLLYKKKSKK